MNLIKVNNTCNIIDLNSNTRNIAITYVYQKKSPEDIIYATILTECRSKLTKNLDSKQFIEFKFDMYDARFTQTIEDRMDVIFIEYNLNYIKNKDINVVDEPSLIQTFKDFIFNKKIDYEHINVVLNTLKLMNENLYQDYAALNQRLSNDSIYLNNRYYCSLENEQKILKSFSIEKLEKFNESFALSYAFKIIKSDEGVDLLNEKLITLDHNKLMRFTPGESSDIFFETTGEQNILCFNFECVGDYYAKYIYNSMLGSGAHSLLFKNIRENLNLCYYVYSKFEQKNTLQIISGINVSNVELCETSILDIMNNEKLFDQKLFLITLEVINSTFEKKQNDFGLVNNLVVNSFISELPISIEEFLININKVTLEDVLMVAKSIKKINKINVGEK